MFLIQSPILALISLALLLLLLCALLNRRLELLIAPFLCGVMLLCYVPALFQALHLVGWMLYAAAFLALAAVLARVLRGGGVALLRSFGRNVFTPGMLCFVILTVLFYIGSRPHIASYWDDIRYWAVEARAIVTTGGLADGVHHLSPRFMTYTPGMQLFQWLGIMLQGEWTEGQLYFSLWLFYAACLAPFAQRITWKTAYWCPLFLLLAIGLPTAMNFNAYDKLQVDVALGLLFGYSLMQVWALRNKDSDAPFALACLCLSLCALVLIKQAGLMWALLSAALLWLLGRGAHRPKTGALLLVTAAPILTYGSWMIFCKVMGLSGESTSFIADYVQQMLNGTWAASAKFDQLPSTLLKALVFSFNGNQWLGLPKLLWIALLLVAPLLLGRFEGAMKRETRVISLWLMGCVLIFLLSFAFSFATVFYTEPTYYNSGDWLSMHVLLERYLCPLLLGGVLLLLWVLQGKPAAAALHPNARSAACAVAGLLLLACCRWPYAYENLAPEQYEKNGPVLFFAQIAEENFWVEDMENPAEAIVLYAEAPSPNKLIWQQYALAPVKLVLDYDAGRPLTQEDFIKLLKDYHVTHVVCMDDQNSVYEPASALAEDGWLDTGTAYVVAWENGAARLEE